MRLAEIFGWTLGLCGNTDFSSSSSSLSSCLKSSSVTNASVSCVVRSDNLRVFAMWFDSGQRAESSTRRRDDVTTRVNLCNSDFPFVTVQPVFDLQVKASSFAMHLPT